MFNCSNFKSERKKTIPLLYRKKPLEFQQLMNTEDILLLRLLPLYGNSCHFFFFFFFLIEYTDDVFVFGKYDVSKFALVSNVCFFSQMMFLYM